MTLVVLSLLFWRNDSRTRPGLLLSVWLLIYGVLRVSLELMRQAIRGLEHLP